MVLYAKYLFKDKYSVKAIREFPFKKAGKQGAWCLRIGKSFECGAKASRDALYKTLEYCALHNIKPIVTSKLLEFDPKVADKVIAAKGIIHISIGIDVLEKGAINQGANNRWRLEQAVQYKNYGCPIQCRIVTDITQPASDFQKEVIARMGGSKGILLTPLHYTNKKTFELLRPDSTWDLAKTSGEFSYAQGDLRPNKFHKDWKQTKEVCGTVNGKECCNNCGLGKFPGDKAVYKAKFE